MEGKVSALLSFEQLMRRASEFSELSYIIVNQLRSCVDFEQAVLFVRKPTGPFYVQALADQSTVDKTSPYIRWIELVNDEFLSQKPSDLVVLESAQYRGYIAEKWNELAHPNLLALPLTVGAKDDAIVGVLYLARAGTWKTPDLALLRHLGRSVGHAIFALQRSPSLWSRLLKPNKKLFALCMTLLIVVMFLPIRMSTVAPAEVIAAQPKVVTAPISGAIEKVAVEPNQFVTEGDLLAKIDDTELEGEVRIARQALQVAQSELKTAQQTAFTDPKQRAIVAELKSMVELKQAELNRAIQRYERTTIEADRDGIVIIGDPTEWTGKPVTVGEKVMLVANPEQVSIEILLPVKDAISMEPGTEVKVFFDDEPLKAFPAILKYAAYEPEQTVTNTMSFRLVAELDGMSGKGDALPRIGTKGVARVFGNKVPVFFYFFRKPITAVRQFLGW